MLFWKGHQLSPDAPIYNTGWKFHLQFDLDEAVFAQAFQDVSSASDAMAAVFVEGENGPIQHLSAEIPTVPEPLDLTQDPEPESALSTWFDDWIAEPFNLGRCTYRAQLVKLAPQHWVWCFAQHHIACDAQSGANLLKAVSDRYHQIAYGQGFKPVSVASFFESSHSSHSRQVFARDLNPADRSNFADLDRFVINLWILKHADP